MSAHITHHTGMPSCAYIASYFVACNCYAVIAASLNPTYDSPTIIRRRSTHLAVVEQTPLRQRCKQLPCHTNLHHGKPKLLGQADNMTSQAPQQTDWEIADQLPNSQLQQHGTAYTLRAANHCTLQFKGVRQVALCRPVDVPARDDTQAQYAPGSASVHLNVLVLDGFTSPIP